MVEDVAEVDCGFRLADRISDGGVCDERPDFVEGREGALPLFALRHVLRKIGFPEIPHCRIADVPEDAVAVRLTGDEKLEPNEGAARHIEEGGNARVEEHLKLRPPAVAPDAFEGIDDRGGDERSVILRNGIEDVEADRVLPVGRIVEEYVAPSSRGNVVEYGFGGIAVRIKEDDTVVGVNVVYGPPHECCALPHSRLAQYPGMCGASGIVYRFVLHLFPVR